MCKHLNQWHYDFMIIHMQQPKVCTPNTFITWYWVIVPFSSSDFHRAVSLDHNSTILQRIQVDYLWFYHPCTKCFLRACTWTPFSTGKSEAPVTLDQQSSHAKPFHSAISTRCPICRGSNFLRPSRILHVNSMQSVINTENSNPWICWKKLARGSDFRIVSIPDSHYGSSIQSRINTTHNNDIASPELYINSHSSRVWQKW